MADDDLLSPEEIEALLSSAGMSRPASAPVPPPPKPVPTKSAPVKSPAPLETSSAERLLDQAEADLRAAVAPILNPGRAAKTDRGEPQPFQFRSLQDGKKASGNDLSLQALEEVELDLRVELGRTELLIEEVLKLREGSVVPLDKLAGDPVDILVNGRLVARGEVLVLNDSFCVRIAEILTPET